MLAEQLAKELAAGAEPGAVVVGAAGPSRARPCTFTSSRAIRARRTRRSCATRDRTGPSRPRPALAAGRLDDDRSSSRRSSSSAVPARASRSGRSPTASSRRRRGSDRPRVAGSRARETRRASALVKRGGRPLGRHRRSSDRASARHGRLLVARAGAHGRAPADGLLGLGRLGGACRRSQAGPRRSLASGFALRRAHAAARAVLPGAARARRDRGRAERGRSRRRSRKLESRLPSA